MGILAIFLGIFGIIFGWFPLVQYFALGLSILGIVFSALALLKAKRRKKMEKGFFRGFSFVVIISLSITSCIKIEIPFINKTSMESVRELSGVKYKIIKPEDYAKQLKERSIGTGERFVIDGLCLGSSEKTLMLQKAGLTNIFTLEEPMDLKFGQKVRIYIEVILVNTILVNVSEAKIIRLEK
jgi:hypothetical protein